MINKKRRNRIGVAALLLISVTASFFIGSKADQRNFEITRNLDIFNTLFKELDLYYVDTIQTEEVVRNGINAMLQQLDPYTQYIPESEKEDFNTMTTGEYGGIGSIIQQRDNKVIISEPYEGMPAQLSDLRPGDAILEIDGESMLGKTVAQVSEKLKGPANTKITLKIEREGTPELIVKELLRQKIQMNAVPYSGMLNDSIGYIYLSSFTDKAAKEVREALIELKKNPDMKGLVLDLRNNPGGILEDAVQIVNYFVPKGETVLSTRGKVKNWDRTYKTTQEPIAPDIPLAVLVNRGSASASEIVAGALQDLDRAVIIGERTFGKGLVQTTRPIAYNGMMKVTTAKYYIPSGRLIQAIDYSHRNPDGSVGRIPDSLTQIYFTKNRRPVRDGGGIQPDFQVENPQVSNLLLYLMRDMMFFDFANQFAATHPNIGPIRDFKLSDADYDAFKQFVKSKEFTYDRQSDKALQELKKIAEFEGYTEQAADEFAALESKLKHNIDRDLDKFRPEIEQALSQEIVRRYYYQKGEIIQTLKKDAELDKAMEIVGNPARYQKVLNMQDAQMK
ncbi:MAG: S41 family peptidase [Bacteroidales bacterium]